MDKIIASWTCYKRTIYIIKLVVLQHFLKRCLRIINNIFDFSWTHRSSGLTTQFDTRCFYFERIFSREIILGNPEGVSVEECALFWLFDIPVLAIVWWYADWVAMRSLPINVHQKVWHMQLISYAFYLFLHRDMRMYYKTWRPYFMISLTLAAHFLLFQQSGIMWNNFFF